MRPPHEMLHLLRTHCLSGLTSRQLQIIGASALGYSTDEIARGLQLSRATVFRHIEILGDRIFYEAGVVPSRHLLVAWSFVHHDCCAAPAWTMIESDQLFDGGHQRGTAHSA